MAVVAQSALVRHAASAKRLLAALQQQADAAEYLIGSDAAKEFLAALEERDRILGELNGVFQAIARERVGTGRERQMQAAVLQEVTQAAATALESHERLTVRAKRERDRLAAAVERSKRPDKVARQYGGYGDRRSAGLSVTG
jgi:hypothetical protein